MSGGKFDFRLGHVVPRLQEGVSPGVRYGPPRGIDDLRGALAASHQVDASSVTITTGASLGLSAALSLLQPSARVALPRPFYPAYPRLCELFGLRPEFYEVEPGDSSAESLSSVAESLASGAIQGAIVNTPGNPMGNRICAKSLVLIQRAAEEGMGLAICDFAYCAFDKLHVDPPLSSHSVSIYSLGKTLGMPGDRIGYVIGSPALIDRMASVHWALAMGPPMTSMILATGRFPMASDLVASARSDVEEAVKILGEFSEIHVDRPSAGYLLWISVPTWRGTATELSQRLGEEGVYTTPGEQFGMQGPYLRASVALGTQTVRAVTHLGDCIRRVLALYPTARKWC